MTTWYILEDEQREKGKMYLSLSSQIEQDMGYQEYPNLEGAAKALLEQTNTSNGINPICANERIIGFAEGVLFQADIDIGLKLDRQKGLWLRSWQIVP